ncbi:hypothetical protein ABXJ76_04240 [Methylobacter sp. G7]|uniref:hypothetical protein n=1 Tax=Methylobacter sp. G7 TaxID=3230117 RepID=UPI003D8099CF
MSKCPFFNKDSKGMPSNEINSNQQQSDYQILTTYWCTHEDSPISSAWVVGGATILRCGGDIEKCQIPPKKFKNQ